MSAPLRRLVLGAALAVVLVVGAIVLWFQIGIITALGIVGVRGTGLQSTLTSAADALLEGDYARGEAQVAQTKSLAREMRTAASWPQLDILRSVPQTATAVTNLRSLTIATLEVALATERMLTLYGNLSGQAGQTRIFSEGRINLDLLKSVPAQVDLASAGLEKARRQLRSIETPTSMSEQLGRARDAALTQMRPVQEALRSVEGIAPVLPAALGAEGPRRYLVAIGNQAEMRASGGAPLTLVMVEFDAGEISIPIKGQTSTELFPPLNAPVRWFGPGPNPFFPGNPRVNPFVVTNTHPNMLYAGQEMAGAWRGGRYPAVDGVVLLDLTAISAVLDATGPITSPTYGEVTGAQLGQILLVDAYATFGQEEATVRQQANQQLLDDLLARLLSGDDLITVTRAIASTAPGRHFQVWMKEPRIQSLALETGIAGQVMPPASGDWSAFYTQNGNQSKVDVFQQRNTLVQVQLAADGSARVRQTFTVGNATPADRPEGPPERVGYETMWVKNAYLMYVPPTATSVRVDYPDGFATRAFKNHARQQLGKGFIDDGFGNRLARVVGWTPPQGTAIMTVDYNLPPGTFTTDDPGTLVYRIRISPQAMFLPPTVTIQVTPPSGFAVTWMAGMNTDGGLATVSAVVDRTLDIGLEFTR